MKKFISFLLVFIMTISLTTTLSGCFGESESEKLEAATSVARNAINEQYEGYFNLSVEKVSDNKFLATASRSRSGDIFSYTQKVSFDVYCNNGNYSHGELSEDLEITLNKKTYYKDHKLGSSYAWVFEFTHIGRTYADIRYYSYNSWEGEFYGEKHETVSFSQTFDEEDGLCFYFSFDGYQRGTYKLTCNDLYYNSAVDPSYGTYRYCAPVNIENYWWYEDIQ